MARRWNVPAAALVNAWSRLQGFDLSTQQHTMATFLLGAEAVPLSQPETVVIDIVVDFVTNRDTSRLARLLEQGDEATTSKEALHITLTLEEFLAANPEWAPGPKTYVYNREEQVPAVYRMQSSGVCSLTAVFVGHNYKCAALGLSGATRDRTIDVTQYIRMHVRGKQLWDYIDANIGFNPEEIAESVFGVKPPKHPSAQIDAACLKHHGPLLVRRFELLANGTFHAAAKTHFSAGDLQPDGGLGDGSTLVHAMLIIGVRVDEAGSKHFLLQNSWAAMPFVDVDEAYWAACDGGANAFPQPKLLKPGEYAMIGSRFAKTCADARVRQALPHAP